MIPGTLVEFLNPIEQVRNQNGLPHLCRFPLDTIIVRLSCRVENGTNGTLRFPLDGTGAMVLSLLALTLCIICISLLLQCGWFSGFHLSLCSLFR